MIDAESFPDDLREELSQFRQIRSAQNQPEPLKNKVQEYEADLIKQTLIDCNWNQSEAARRLDTSEKNIRYKMEKMNIKKSDAD
jgi:DNA-binding NtrC family response regulator